MPDLPGPTTSLAGIKEWANPVFVDLLPYAYLAAGLILAVGLIWFLVRLASHTTDHMKGK